MKKQGISVGEILTSWSVRKKKKDVLARIRMIARLKQYLGDQKIDIIGDHEDSPVVYEALKKGMRLV